MTSRVPSSSETVHDTSAGMPMILTFCTKLAPCSGVPGGSPCGQPSWIVSHSSKRLGSVASANAASGGAATSMDLLTDGMAPSSEPHRLADELFHDLVGARVDPRDPRVDPRFRDGVLRRVAVTAVQLHADVGHAVEQLGRLVLRHRRLLDRGGPGDVALDRAVDVAAQHLDLGLELGHEEARVLERPDRLAERLALLDVRER